MYSDFQCRARSIDEEPIDCEQELKLIFDLTRRIQLLEELIQSAQARRQAISQHWCGCCASTDVSSQSLD